MGIPATRLAALVLCGCVLSAPQVRGQARSVEDAARSLALATELRAAELHDADANAAFLLRFPELSAGQLPGGRFELLRLVDGHPVLRGTHNYAAGISIRVADVRAGGWVGTDLRGRNRVVAIWDAETALTSHVELAGRITVRDGSESASHATHVTGTLVAAGVRPEAEGIVPEALVDAWDWQNDSSEMATAGANGTLVSNHSYGTFGGWVNDLRGTGRWAWMGDPSISQMEDYRYGYYGDEAAAWDAIAHASPHYVIVKSAGNERADRGPPAGAPHDVFSDGWIISNVSREPDGGQTGFDSILDAGIGKNVLTIGAVEDLPGGYAGPEDVAMSTFSGFGPTDDGRIKPDLVANGTSVLSSVAGDEMAYAHSSGTSMSTPVAAGAVVLVQEAFEQVLGAVPLSSMVRAILIHAADEAGTSPGPDYRFGWGLINVARAVAHIQAAGSKPERIITGVVSPGETVRVPIQVGQDGLLEATLAWTDPAAEPETPRLNSTTSRLVNDLDLVASGSGGDVYPWTLSPAQPNAPAIRAPNRVDTVERISAGVAPGSYVLTVTSRGSDAQEFSLVTGAAPDGSASRGWVSGRVVVGSIGVGGVTISAGAAQTASAADGSFVFPDLPAGRTAVVPQPGLRFQPDTLWLDVGTESFAQFSAPAGAHVESTEFFFSPDLLTSTESGSRLPVSTPVPGGVYGAEVSVRAMAGIDLQGGRVSLKLENVPGLAPWLGDQANRLAATGAWYALSSSEPGLYRQRVPIVWLSPDASSGPVRIPYSISDRSYRLVAADTMSWQIAGSDTLAPLIYASIPVEGRAYAAPGSEIILRADVLDPSGPTTVTALISERDGGGFVRALPLKDEGDWVGTGDAVPSDRLFSGLFSPTRPSEYRVDYRAVDALGNAWTRFGAWHVSSRPFLKEAPVILLTWSERETRTDAHRSALAQAGVAHDFWEFDVRSQIPDSTASAYEVVIWSWANRTLNRPEDTALLGALLVQGHPLVLIGTATTTDDLVQRGMTHGETRQVTMVNGAPASPVWNGFRATLPHAPAVPRWIGGEALVSDGDGVLVARIDGAVLSTVSPEHLEEWQRPDFMRRLVLEAGGNPSLVGVERAPAELASRVKMAGPFPNPARSAASVRIDVDRPADIEITLFDLLGRQAATVHRSILGAGTHDVRLQLDGLTAGVYQVVARTGDVATSAPLVLVR
ncbi:MAG: S8 family peptidase [Rhodothermales bacterium]|nr:S8 family peptidase [Rhodothermales bacterium]MBO6779939.1 S8 family peptidase [Rhodothermales bacterium]